jgi:tetratricopeptide (TPR) repeat protein
VLLLSCTCPYGKIRMRSAFVSHSTKDDYYVTELESLLRAADFDDVFNDVSSIKPDEQLWPKIERGIGACDTVFVVITAASNTSDWVRREVECARRLGKKVVPLWVEDCPVPAIFQGRDVIDLRRRTRDLLRSDISRIVKYAPADLIGREAETKILTDAWGQAVRAESNRPHVLTFVALGGEGKTSLVAKWAASLAHDNWPGCDAVFAWSFYSQGTREQTAVSSDLFLAEALTFFGDAAMAGSAQGAFEKGRRLAQLVGERRALLILDGLEPLQYAPTTPTPGELKDQGLSALLKGLAATSHGLCVLTTRYALPDLRAFHGKTVREEKLERLARDAGVQLLKAHGVTGSDRRNLPLHDGGAQSELVSEFEKLVEDVDGHALTLHIMGSFLKKAFGGDIRKRDRVTFAKASQKTDNGHAFRAMETYARWMEDGSDEARRELAILRLMGLFDRPATADCLAALLAAPAIPGLTEPLTGLPEEDWNCSLESLVAAKLLSVSPETVSVPAAAFPLPASLDAHPLIREYFAERLKSSPLAPREQPGAPATEKTLDESKRHAAAEPTSHLAERDGYSAWREAHRRLYEHLCASTQEGDQPTLEDLQPLYQAVAHGCQAGLQQEAHDKVWFGRIRKGNDYYSMIKLGAFGSDLGAVTCFFDPPWSRVSPALAANDQAVLLNSAAISLRALGRLTEALEPMRAGLEVRVKQEVWKSAAINASNLSELELTLGEVAGAVGDAEQSVTYADRSGDAFNRMLNRTTLADALHLAGRRAEAEARFREAEQMQAERQPHYPLLYSLQGFRYCDLLLVEAERTAWEGMLRMSRSVLAAQSRSECSGRDARGHPGIGDTAFARPSDMEKPQADAGGVSAVGRGTESTAPAKAVSPPLQGSATAVQDAAAPDDSDLANKLRAVSERAAQTLKIAERSHWLLDIALDHLTLGRSALYTAILGNFDIRHSTLTTPSPASAAPAMRHFSPAASSPAPGSGASPAR